MAGEPARRLRSRAAPAAKTALLRLGGYAALRGLRPSRKAAILRYHAVCGPEGHAYADPAICVSPSAFERHARYLADHYSVLALDEVVARLRDGRPLPRNCVSLTFDDGYADNRQAAVTLARHGLTATFYLTAACLRGGEPFWPSEVRALVRRLPGPTVRLSAGRETHDITLDGDRRQAIAAVNRLCKSCAIPVRERLRTQLRELAGVTHIESPMLGWDDVAAMRRAGMTIGAHTLTHPNLPNAGEADAWHEISGSKERLQRELGVPVTLFSYPNGGSQGYMTSALAHMVCKAGFTAATTSRNGFAGTQSDLFALERIQVSERLEDLVFALELERVAFAPAPRPFESQA